MAPREKSLYSTPGSVLMDWVGPDGVEKANAELARLAPRSESQSWLHCYWEPGEPWMPIHRLIIAEMTPRSVLAREHAFYRSLGESGDASLFAELEGPNPRDSGRFVAGHLDQRGRYIDDDFVYDDLPPNITQRQWLLWQSERAFARPIWIIQGKRGGHKRRFNQLESTLLKMRGRPGDAPHPGQLPYAPFDRRILDSLFVMAEIQMQAEALMKWASLRQDAEEYKTKQSMEARVAEAVYAWLDPQIEEVAA